MTSGAVAAIAAAQLPKNEASVESLGIRIGKDVLELITGAMYVEPLTIFREYIQNAADALEVATREKLLAADEEALIEIVADPSARLITIRDNGIGVPASEFWSRMTAIGSSPKRGSNQRGFRGVGRLSGLGYAVETKFRSRFSGENRVSEIIWDGRRLRELLRDASYKGSLAEIVKEVTRASTSLALDGPKHFFEVQLRGVSRIGKDVLLNSAEIASYLAQHGPVPFARGVRVGAKIEKFLAEHGVGKGLAIRISGNDGAIVRPLSDRIETHGKIASKIDNVELIEVPSLDGAGIDVVGWVAHHSYFGAIPKSAGYGGLRVRSGNIQVGEATLLEHLFAEPRFNSWTIGEFHVLSQRIVPNGRRDGFETNAHLNNFLSHAAAVAIRQSKLCRERSIQRNRVRQAARMHEAANEQLVVIRDPKTPAFIRNELLPKVEKALGKLCRYALNGKLTAGEKCELEGFVSNLQSEIRRLNVTRRREQAVEFLPRAQRDVFLQTLKMVVNACESAEEAAQIVRKVFLSARRRYTRRR